MDSQLHHTDDQGNKLNRFGEKLIPCELCGHLTTMLGTKRCDSCWELERRIKIDPKLAYKILAKCDSSPISDQVAIIKEAREALDELYRLKTVKDVLGKTVEYLRDQPLAWNRARDVLDKLIALRI